MPRVTNDARAKLGRLIKARRLALGLSLSRAAKSAPIDRVTWTAAEDATRSTRRIHFAAIERVLHWSPGSIDAILDGRDPTELPEPPAAPRRAAEAEPTLEQEIERLKRLPGLTPRERRAALRALIDFYAEDIDEDTSERPTA
jgi:hypothetical protein